MGAAASVHAVYEESGRWFKEYFDSDLYRKDFEDIDKDNDGGISYSELHRWIRAKADKEGGPWKVFLSNPDVIQFAHVQSCSTYKRHDTVLKKKVIGIDDFRTFLVHLFSISVLWVHFKNADEFVNSDDFGNMKLSIDEFKLAVKTLTATHEREECSEEQLLADFTALDHDKSNSLGFVEVCAHCCRYIDPSYDPNASASALAPELAALQEQEDRERRREPGHSQTFTVEGVEQVDIAEDVLADLEETSDAKRAGQFKTIKSRNLLAVEALQQELDREKAAAKFEEMKFTTENEMNALLRNL